LWLDIVGWSHLRGGRPQQYFVIYGNHGNVDAPAGNVLWLQLSAFLRHELGPGAPASVEFTLGDTTDILFVLEAVSVGENRLITVSLTLPDDPQYGHTIFELQAWLNSRR
jgi:hypothetical protein